MRGTVLNPIGSSQVLKSKTGLTILTQRPLDTLRPQRAIGAGHIQQIPTRVAVLPLPCVDIEEITPQGKARNLIVKPNRVVTNAAGVGLRELSVNPPDELHLGVTLRLGLLRRNARHPHCRRVRKPVRSGSRIERQRLTDDLKISVGADPRKLPGPILCHIGTGGFIVVPVEGLR